MMKLSEISKNNLIKTSVIFSVFMVFLSGAIDIVQITFNHEPILHVSSKLFDSDNSYSLSRFIYTPEFAYLTIIGLLLSFSLPILSPLKAFILSILVLFSAVGFDYIKQSPSLIPMEYFLLSIIIIYTVNVLVSYFIEIHSKQALMKSFGQYIPPHLVNELSRLPKDLSLEGEAKTLTVFFCDLQNFTRISEELNPIQLNKLLNEYFTVMTEILFKYDGTIDKYIGDAIMAFWNAPTTQAAHAQRAVEAALEMDKAIRILADSFIKRGWPGPSMGIGINTGRANVGNMGSKYRMTYTAIGDAVNLASRIETLTRTYRVPVIITENTFSKLDGVTCREIDTVRVRGKHQQTRIYQPLCYTKDVNNQLKEKLILHKEALELYYAEKYKNAARLYKELYEKDKTDKLYKVMLQKSLNL